MDKQLLKAYIKVMVEEEVKRLLPQMLAEAVAEVKQLSETRQPSAQPKKAVIDRGRLAELMGITYDGETLRATTNNMAVPLPENTPRDVDPEVVKAVTRDYSQLMKAMKLT